MEYQRIHSDLINTCQELLVNQFLKRVKICLSELTNDEIWIKPNENTTSVGNLVLHLEGNVRQWIIAALGNKKDIRQRQKEFVEERKLSKTELVAHLSNAVQEAGEVLETLANENLLKIFKVQSYEKTGVYILIHVVEHFSYHLGQITYFTKSRKNIDTGYYSGHNLNRTN